MTNEEIRIKVAEARGWKQKTYVDRDPGGAIHRYPGCWFNENEYGDIPLNLPEYTTSMDACMELLEDITKSGQLFIEIERGENCWRFVIEREIHYPDEDGVMADEVSKTLPEAICKAYLAWKEEQ